MLGLGYPGGPIIEKMAELGDEHRFVLPRPLSNSDDCNLSFSGLKTAVRKIIESYSDNGTIEHAIMRKQDIADVCASFQTAVADCLIHKLQKAIKIFKQKYPEGKDIVVSGGVASNSMLRKVMAPLDPVFSEPRYSTDNAMGVAVLAKRMTEG